jgi:Flp pilus assembly protein TadD
VNFNNLAGIVARRGHLAEAEVLYRRSLEIKERTVGPSSPAVAISLNNLAMVQRRQRRYVDAEAGYRRAVEILEASVDPDHPNLEIARRNLAAVRALAGHESAGPTGED